MTLAEFRAAYPAFNSVDDAEITTQLNLFSVIYQGSYGTWSDHLQGLYVAHQLTVFCVNSSSAPSKTVTSRSVDGLSWSYATPKSDDNYGSFSSSKYGVEFERLMKMVGSGGPIISGVYRGNL